MYRLTPPNLIIFIPILVLGIVLTLISPKYIGSIRVISLIALLIGELGLSFIPVLAFYPKANLIQGLLLGIVYFFTTFIICFAAWGISDLGNATAYAFTFKNGEFYINTHALFIANIFSLIELLLNFRLVYDEELTKLSHQKHTIKHKEKRTGFSSFEKTTLKRPQFDTSTTASTTSLDKDKLKSTSQSQPDMEEEFLKPFEFEPEISPSIENLPAESRGNLFSNEPNNERETKQSDFFDDDDESHKKQKPTQRLTENPIEKPLERPKPIQINPFPPSDIKKDLAAIFEQYSSLDAVKKLTGSKVNKPINKIIENDKSKRKPYILSEKQQMAVHIEGQEIVDASFRQISEAEKLEEIKDELKKELQETVTQETQKMEETFQKTSNTKDEIIESIRTVKEELKKEFQEKIEEKAGQDAQKIEETLQKTSNTKDEIIESIKNIKEELKKEFQEKLEERAITETQKIEEDLQKTSNTKDEILESIKNIKEELISSLKEEMKKEFFEEQRKENEIKKEEEKTNLKDIYNEKITENIEEDINLPQMEEQLNKLNKLPETIGSLYLTSKGKLQTEKWVNQFSSISIEDSNTLANAFNIMEKELNNTNQGNLCNLLLESDDGTFVISKSQNKLLTVISKGKGEIFCGTLLRTLSEIENN